MGANISHSTVAIGKTKEIKGKKMTEEYYCIIPCQTGNKSYDLIPYPFITSFAEEEWFFGNASRKDVEFLLVQPESMPGTFSIRNGEETDTFVLSLKEFDPIKNEDLMKHYKIQSVKKAGYFIADKIDFRFISLKQLVAHLSGENGFSIKLNTVCRRSIPFELGTPPIEVPFVNLDYYELVGKGSNETVFRGKFKGIDVAIKRLSTSNKFRREVLVLNALNHPKIVSLLAICSESNGIVMEWMCYGCLEDYLKTELGRDLKFPSLANMAAQIADGMQYLETRNLIHRALTGRNILVGDGGILKLAGFGSARRMYDTIHIEKSGDFPVKWTAPEALSFQTWTAKSDVWSYGNVLYQLFTRGKIPYEDMTDEQAKFEITEFKHRLPKPTDPECSDDVYEIMKSCWEKIPEERPTFKKLYLEFTKLYSMVLKS